METEEIKHKDREGVITTVDYSLDSTPLDLMIEILLKLPAKSLLVCKSVSKKWCSIIRSQIFIDTFLSVSISRPLFLFTYQRDFRTKLNYNNKLIFFSSPHHISPESNDSSSIVARHEMTMSKTCPGKYIIHSTSVRGFICCSYTRGHDNHQQYMVCNPTTRQVIRLPEDHGTMKCVMHLGYDPSNDKYKVLRMVTEPWRRLVSEHSVYTLERQQSSNLPWRRVESDISNYYPCSDGVYINGVVYYKARTRSSVIFISFDFGSERFGQIKQPEETLTCLANYKGKLAGLSFLKETSFRLWVLDDVKEQIWSKTDTFDFDPSFWHLKDTFSGATDAGELVFGGSPFANAVYILFFDIKTKKMRRVALEGFTNYDSIWRISSSGHIDNILFINLN